MLILVILLNTVIFSIFKLFSRFCIDSLQAITVNYWVCVLTGTMFSGINPVQNLSSTGWLIYALLLGVLLIGLFNLLSYSTNKEGMMATTIANKLSLVIPVFFSYYLYSDSMDVLKMLGIILALPAVYLSSYKKERLQMSSLLLPFIIFLGSGFMDTFLKYVQHHHLSTEQSQAHFSIVGFGVAASIGSMIVVYKSVVGKHKIELRSVIAGVLLGVPNYFSIFLLIRLLDSGMMQSSAIIPVNNIGIVLVTTIVAISLFKEKATGYKVAGIGLSLLSILMIILGEQNG
ncbi:MAG: EamA family transporter [Chitinophagaceae bacterium]|nr:EamA family transporter [Chitinophagaceae bacterium]